MNKKMISLLSTAALTLTFSTSAFASPGNVDRYVNLRSAPSTDSRVYETLRPGTNLEVLDQVNRYWLKVEVDGKVGYVSPSYINSNSTDVSTPAQGRGTVERSVHFRSAPSTDSTVYETLRPGTAFKLVEQVNRYWLKIEVNGKTGYVSPNYVNYKAGAQPAPQPSPQPTQPAEAGQTQADRIIEHAKDLIGITKYKFGVNRAPSVMDCSAFTKYVFGQEGISMKWGTRYQKDDGIAVSRSNLKKGDLVFFWISSEGKIGHVGIYIGNGQIIHNSPSMGGVGISSLNSGYWDKHYVSARRIL